MKVRNNIYSDFMLIFCGVFSMFCSIGLHFVPALDIKMKYFNARSFLLFTFVRNISCIVLIHALLLSTNKSTMINSLLEP